MSVINEDLIGSARRIHMIGVGRDAGLATPSGAIPQPDSPGAGAATGPVQGDREGEGA